MASATDSDRPPNKLTYSLSSDAPAGTAIGATTGHFTWTPSEQQGPSTNAITVIVTDGGVPSLSSTQTLIVTVREVNSAPSLASVPVQTAYVQTMLRITNVVNDPDIPTNEMRFALAGGTPVGARINTNSGVFSWMPTKAQAPSSNYISVIVTDNGVPPLTATNGFGVVVGDFLELSLGSAVSVI